MSQQAYEDGGQGGGGGASGEPRDIQRLRQLAEENPTIKAENEQLKRQLAVRDAGITAEQMAADPKLKFFVENYKGDPTVEAIKAQATELGFIAPPAADPAVQQAQQGQQAVVAAGTGTAPSATDDVQAGLQKAYQDGAASGRGMEAMQEYARQHNIPVSSR